MVVITIELWPHGDKTKRRTIAAGSVINDGTGTAELGNYEYGLSLPDGKMLCGTVQGYRRKGHSVWHLLKLILNSRHRIEACKSEHNGEVEK